MASIGAAGNNFVHQRMEFFTGEIFAGPDHALHEITLHPTIKRGVPVLVGAPQNIELAPIIIGDPWFFQGYFLSERSPLDQIPSLVG